MTQRRVIFPPPHYWTDRNEQEQPTMTGTAPIQPPQDCMYATAENINITLAADPDGSLNFGLLITAPAPLGAIRIKLFREQVAGLRERLNELAGLTEAEVAEFMHILRGNQPTE